MSLPPSAIIESVKRYFPQAMSSSPEGGGERGKPGGKGDVYVQDDRGWGCWKAWLKEAWGGGGPGWRRRHQKQQDGISVARPVTAVAASTREVRALSTGAHKVWVFPSLFTHCRR